MKRSVAHGRTAEGAGGAAGARGPARTRVAPRVLAALFAACLLAALPWEALAPAAFAQVVPAQATQPAPAAPAAPASAASAGAGAPASPAAPAEGTAAAARSGGSPDRITLNFKDADIDSVVGAFGHLLNRAFLIDPRVRGKITLETPKPVTRAQAYQLLQASLRVQGFAIVDNGEFARVVPEADAKLQSGPVGVGRGPERSGDQVLTQIFRLSYESASNLVPVLRPLITANNTITAYPANNSLVITDYAANLQRLGRIIAALDSPSTNEVEVVPIRHAVAADIAVAVSRLVDDGARAGQGAQVDSGQRVAVLADPRINSVLVRTPSPAKMNLAKTLIARLDQPSASPGNINVVYLRNAEAVRLAQVLRGVLTGEAGAAGGLGSGLGGGLGAAGGFGSTTAGGLTTTAQPTLAGQPGGTALGGTAGATTLAGGIGTAGGTSASGTVTVSAGGAIIAADTATNSLIITAPEPIYRNLRGVIDRLDARRVQVFIESLIVEVSAEKAAEFGIQWQFLSGTDKSGTSVVGGTNLPPRGTGANILDIAANPLAAGQGLNLGVVGGVPITIGGVQILNLNFLARALETQANGNVLATPNLLTLDNEEARIIIGQNVPFVTGQFTNTGTAGGAVNPFQTIERRDVGTTLRVRPQVSEGGTIRLQIFQEVSSVQSQTVSGLITNRRAIESNVLVDDGQIVVLGGLIEERVEGSVNKVPWLGDVPGVGWLFRYDNRKRTKTNLMVFLRPVLLRTADDSYAVTSDRYDYVRQLQFDARFPQRLLLPDIPPSDLSPMSPSPRSKAAPGQPGGASSTGGPPASLSPDVEAAIRRATAVGEKGRGVIQTAPNEVVVPLPPASGEPQAAPPSAGEPPASQPPPGGSRGN